MVRKVDLSTELQILAFHEQRRVATRLTALPGKETDGDSEPNDDADTDVNTDVDDDVNTDVDDDVDDDVDGDDGALALDDPAEALR
jgi:hypothetical protein